MQEGMYRRIEAYMLEQMRDSAHDKEHIYRVLYVALDIASQEAQVDLDVLITACLLHDIARDEQFADPSICHARLGGEKAEHWLLAQGFDGTFAGRVKECIQTHRYRADCLPQSIEAKILFDADKIDAAGALGIARTLLYQGHEGEPLYNMDEEGQILDGTMDKEPSFLREYQFKLKKLYDHFFTQRGREMAKARQASAEAFYQSLLGEAKSAYQAGARLLHTVIE